MKFHDDTNYYLKAYTYTALKDVLQDINEYVVMNILKERKYRLYLITTKGDIRISITDTMANEIIEAIATSEVFDRKALLQTHMVNHIRIERITKLLIGYTPTPTPDTVDEAAADTPDTYTTDSPS